jgi:hypothetical protein
MQDGPWDYDPSMFSDSYPEAMATPAPGADGLIRVEWNGGTADHAAAGRMLFGEREAGSIMPRPGALGRLVYSLRHGCWMRLDDLGIWRMEPKARVHTMAEETLDLVRVRRIGKDGSEKWVPIARTNSTVQGILTSGRNRATVEAQEWPEPAGVVWADGKITSPDLRTRALVGTEGATWALKWPCPKPGPTPVFDDYTDTLWGEHASAYRMVFFQWLGACLCGMATRYQRALLLYGQPGRGKSVLLTVVRELFPPEAVTGIEPGAGDRFDAAGLARSRLNLITDLKKAENWASGWFKSAIVGDLVDIERKGVDRETIIPRAGWLVGSNLLPDIRDPAVERRIVLLHCNGPKFEEGDPKRNDLLPHLIHEQEGHLLVWKALEHHAAMMQRRRGYDIPPVARELMAEARRYDAFIGYLEDVLTPAPGCRVSLQSAYEAYRRFCARTGGAALAEAKFRTRIREAGLDLVKASAMHIRDRTLTEPLPDHLDLPSVYDR